MPGGAVRSDSPGPAALADEALAVVLGLLAGSRMGLPTAAYAVEGALAKLHRVMPDHLRRQVAATREAVGWGRMPSSPTGESEPVNAGVLLALGVAAHDGRQVRIIYRARSGETTARALDPYGIVFGGQTGRKAMTAIATAGLRRAA